MNDVIPRLFTEHGLVASFALVGIVMWISYQISKHLTLGRIHGSAIAIVLGLVLAYFGGVATGGKTGIADIPLFAGVGLMGGAMLRDFAIVATAFEVDVVEAKKAGDPLTEVEIQTDRYSEGLPPNLPAPRRPLAGTWAGDGAARTRPCAGPGRSACPAARVSGTRASHRRGSDAGARAGTA